MMRHVAISLSLLVASACGQPTFHPTGDGGIDAMADARATGAPAITTTMLPSGEVALAYTATLIAEGSQPITWTITSGTLPPGLALESKTGVISGTPTQAGQTQLTVQADNGMPPVATAALTLVIDPQLQSVDGITIPNPSKHAQQFGPVHAGENGAGPDINAWSVSPSRCTNAVPAITKYWHHNIDLPEYGGQSAIDFPAFAPNEALTYQFTPTIEGVTTIYMTTGNGSNGGGAPAPTYISLSTTPCDFDPAKANVNNCYFSGGPDNGITFHVTNGATTVCKLVPGTRYYLNVRFWLASNPTVDACQTQLDYINNGTTKCQYLMKIQSY